VHTRVTGRGHYTLSMNTLPRLDFARAPCALLSMALIVTSLAVQAQAQGSANSSASGQWVWRDKAGRVTASDLPPPRDIAEQDIISRPAPRPAARPSEPRSAAAAASSSAPGPVDRELEARRKAAEAQKTAQAKAEEEKVARQRADNCRRARAQATALESGQRMARINDQGEREVLDDKGRVEELRRAREVISADCR
jgi:hypothetical protein